MLKKMKIGKRLLITFLLVVLFSSFAGLIGITLIQRLNHEYSSTLHDYGFSQGNIGGLGQVFQAHRATILYIANAKTPEEQASYIEKLNTQVEEINQQMQALKIYMKTESEQTFYSNLMDEMNKYDIIRSQFIELLSSNPDEAKVMLSTQAAPLGLEIADTINKAMADKSSAGDIKAAELTRMSSAFIIIMCGIILISIVSSIIIALFITRGITSPINELKEAANQMAEGALKCSLEYQSEDELGILANSMRTMMERISHYMDVISFTTGKLAQGDFDIPHDNEEFKGEFRPVQISIQNLSASLNNVMTRISQASNQVASGADQVSSGAQALSQGATEQASSIEELAATTSDILHNINRNAKNAKNANLEVKTTESELAFGKEQMTNLTDAMNTISSASAEISKVIKVIEDIAFQTNILALNAAVEAARAGGAGKGFAVVANEVRSLANKSQEASKNTALLIERTLKSIESGNNIARETAETMDHIVSASKTMAELVSQISEASEEQAQAVSQVTVGIDQISSVVQTNSATSEESAAASEELAAQAQTLNQLVAQFKLKSR